jgi:hypothetical protein
VSLRNERSISIISKLSRVVVLSAKKAARGEQRTPRAPPQAPGRLFGPAVAPYDQGVYFVDDATDTLDLRH